MVTFYTFIIGLVLFLILIYIDIFLYKFSFWESFDYMFSNVLNTGKFIVIFGLFLGFAGSVFIDYRLKKNKGKAKQGGG